MRHPDWLVPAWSAQGVGALMTTRAGGVSEAPFDSMNLRAAVGDEPLAVAHNRAIFAAATGVAPVYLDQVHGRGVQRLGLADAQPDAPVHRADASITTERGIACAVQVADCLPVLFAAPAGRGVGAAHAGWRGLAAGVLEATVSGLCRAAECVPADLCAWLGPCIGPREFEVGADVLRAFGADPGAADQPGFIACRRAGKWLADLPWLARQRLLAAGVNAISGGAWCTVSQSSDFFSFRRDGITGRMAAAVWLG